MSSESDFSLVFSPSSGSETEALLDDRFRILPDSPLPELDLKGAAAFVARDERNQQRQLFARLCDPGIYPRVETMVQLKNLHDGRLVHALEWGPVYWPPDRRRRFAVVFDRPSSDALMPSLDDRIQPIDSEVLAHRLITPAIETLRLLARRGHHHRAIRPDNLFYLSDPTGDILLGDCFTVPPGFGQPVAVETIEMAMVPPHSRGRGTIADDMYALGATSLFLALGCCPVAHMTDRDIIAAKAQQGSFNALLGEERPPLGLREVLRGLLCDDPFERWTPDDLEQYLSGDQRRTVSIVKEVRVDRPFTFEGQDYRNCRLLAHAFLTKWQSGAGAIREGEFEKWVARGLTDARGEESIADMVSETIAGSASAPETNLISQICMILDPLSPLGYKDLIVTADGLGNALAVAISSDDRDRVQLIAETIAKGAAVEWLGYRERILGIEGGPIVKTLKRMQQLIKIKAPGYGVERCFYDLNQFAPCASKLFEGAYVYSLRDLIPALEAIVREKGELPHLIDRHIVAFVASRSKGQLDRKLSVLEDGGGKSITAKLGMVDLLGLAQREHGPDSAPHLTKWLAGELRSAVDQFNSRSMREELLRKLDAVSETGKIFRLHAHLNDPQTVRRDNNQCAAAKREYARANSKIAELESESFQDNARRTGWRIASGISTSIAVMTIAALAMWA